MEEFIKNTFYNLISGGLAGAIVMFLFKTYLSEKIRKQIGYEYDRLLVSYKSELSISVEKDLENYRSTIRDLEAKNLDKWRIKRDACLLALDIADAALSQMSWEGIDSRGRTLQPNSIVKSPIDTVKVRQCYNQLACSCDYTETLVQFKKVIGLTSEISADVILDFRNTIRRELGFGQEIDLDKTTALIARIDGDNQP